VVRELYLSPVGCAASEGCLSGLPTLVPLGLVFLMGLPGAIDRRYRRRGN